MSWTRLRPCALVRMRNWASDKRNLERDMSAQDPKTPRDEDDVTDLATLELLAEALGNLSKETTGMPTTWRMEEASLAFAKVGITCWTFLRLIPGSSYYGAAKGHALWDLSAAATQCRCLVEAYHVLVYLIHEPVSSEERGFQKLLWEYHCECERYKMLKAAIPDSRNLPRVAQDVAALKSKLEADRVFLALSLNPRRRKQILAGDCFKLDDNIALSRKAGISETYYRSNYKYCSAFAHTAPFSISQLRHFTAGDDAAKQLMVTLVGYVCAYSAMAVRDFAALFPDQMLMLSPEIRKIIAIWEGILVWEKSDFFGGSPS